MTTAKEKPAWATNASEATEKKIDDEVKPAFPKRAPAVPVGYSSYKVVESKFENDVVKSKRRNPPKNPEMTKKLFCQVDKMTLLRLSSVSKPLTRLQLTLC